MKARSTLVQGICLLVAMASQSPVHADVRCPPVFGPHMVLQRDKPVPVWGTSAPGENIHVEFAGKSVGTTAGRDGLWQVRLPSLPANAQPATLVVRGTNELRFEDVLVGEVWLCSGQSNMEKPIGQQNGQQPTDHAMEDIRNADHPRLRLYQTPRGGKPRPDDLTLQWHPCTPETIEKLRFSAAGYFFGCEILEKLDVPVGLIHTSFGGTRIEPWTVPTAYQGIPALKDFAKAAAGDRKIDGIRIGDLYDSMVKPLVPFSLRGFIWYQGESNLVAGDVDDYPLKMRALVEGWRTAWGEPAAPFYFVQLAPHLYTNRKQPKPLSPDALPLFWEAQARALAIPNTGMAVINDTVVNPADIHPTNKRDVGQRLARLALARTYQKPVGDSGPVFKELKIRGASAGLVFEHADGLRSKDGQPLRGFEIAGANRVFEPAAAAINDGKIVVSSPGVAKPVAVRFAWSERAGPNLVNSDGLPASAFRTDNWPLQAVLPAIPEKAPAKSSGPR